MVEEIGGVDALVEIEVEAVEVALVEAREVECCFAEGFRGKGASVGGGAAGETFLFNEGDLLAEVGRLRGRNR